MFYRIHFRSRNGKRANLSYTLLDTPVARKFQKVTQDALSRGGIPFGVSFHRRLGKRDFLNEINCLNRYVRELNSLGEFNLPVAPLTLGPELGSVLNFLHQAFHLAEEKFRETEKKSWKPGGVKHSGNLTNEQYIALDVRNFLATVKGLRFKEIEKEFRKLQNSGTKGGSLRKSLLDLQKNPRPGSVLTFFYYYYNEIGINSELARAIRALFYNINCAIHRIEEESRMPRVKKSYASLLSFNLTGESKVPLSISEYAEFRLNRSFGDLILGYGTIGKNLYSCFIDNDMEVVRNRLVRPQVTVSTGAIVMLTTSPFDQDSKPPELREFHEWCERNDIRAFGYRWEDPIHRPGQVLLGRLRTKITEPEMQEFLSRYPILEKVSLSSR